VTGEIKHGDCKSRLPADSDTGHIHEIEGTLLKVHSEDADKLRASAWICGEGSNSIPVGSRLAASSGLRPSNLISPPSLHLFFMYASINLFEVFREP
jgi:hypothetical protein